MLENYLAGLSLINSPAVILTMAAGVVGGLIIGAIPGLTSTMAIALLVPLTFGMAPAHGLAMLMAVYCGGISGGLVSAILLNIPGTPSSAGTCLDGFPMARKGEAVRALGLGVYSSFWGGLLSGIALIIIAPLLASFALRFGPWEYFALVIFTFSCISSLSKGSLIKAFLAAGIGLMLALVGTDPVDGVSRFTFGLEELISGFAELPALIGVFAIPQLLMDVDSVGIKEEVINVHFRMKEFMKSQKELLRNKLNFIRSWLIGLIIGILPGVGPGLSNVVAYAQARSASRHPEKFGTGVPEGIIAPETANNASMGGALIPLLTLGIPGDASTLMMLGSFMIHNIQPGPLLFRDHSPLVYSLFISYFISFWFMILFYHFFIRIIIRVITVPRQIMIPTLLVLCSIGCYALNNRMFDVYCFWGFGLLGYLLEYLKIPVLPVVLGLILGKMAEVQFRLAMNLANGSFLPFFTRPISLILIICSILSVMLPIYLRYKKSKNFIKDSIFEK